MSHRLLSIEEAEAKLISSFTNLIWIIPFIFLIELFLVYNGSIELAWEASDLISVFTGLFWLIFGLRLIKFTEKELNARRSGKNNI